MTHRAFISTKRRGALFIAKAGICHLCSSKIMPPEAWDVSHVIPLELGGADDESNWDIAHRRCHRVHTAVTDVPNIAKAKRREARHVGTKAPARARIPLRPKPPRPIRDKLPLPPRQPMYE